MILRNLLVKLKVKKTYKYLFLQNGMKKNIIFILMLIFMSQLGFSDLTNTGNDGEILNNEVEEVNNDVPNEDFTNDGIAIDNNIIKEKIIDFDINKFQIYKDIETAEAACAPPVYEPNFELRCIQTKYLETSYERKDKYFSAVSPIRYVTKEYPVPIYKCSKYDLTSLNIRTEDGAEYYNYPDDFNVKDYPCIERKSNEIEGYICKEETRMEENKSERIFCGYTETLEDLKCSELGGKPHCILKNKPKECECLFDDGYIQSETHDCSEYSQEGGIVYSPLAYTQHRTCTGCYWSMWQADKYKDNNCKILDCPAGSNKITTVFGDICFPYALKNIGSEKSSGTKNIVSFCGINKEGKSMNVKASCKGDWSVDPCNWESECSTGWEFDKTEIYEGCSHTCPNTNVENTSKKRPNVINIKSEFAKGDNSRVILCGRKNGVSLSGIATCSGNWWVDPCNWESECSTGWEYNPKDYKENACTDTCPNPAPTSKNIGSQTSSGNNNIVSFCGSKGTGKALCEGHWYVNPKEWTSSCDTQWKYNANDYGKPCNMNN